MGVLEGDFNEDSSLSQILIRTLLTLIPGVDQVADIQDVTAALYKLAWEKRYDEFGPWFDLFLTLIGLVPTAGSGAKGFVKWVEESAGNVDLSALRPILDKFGVNADEILRDLPVYVVTSAAEGKKQLQDLSDRATKAIATLKGIKLDPTGGKLRQITDKLEELKVSFNKVLSDIDGQFQEIGESLKDLGYFCQEDMIMSSFDNEYWPFVLSDKEKEDTEVLTQIEFLKSVTKAGFQGYRFGEVNYGASSNIRLGNLIKRGRRKRWELVLHDNEECLSAFISDFQIAGGALLHWLEGASIQNVLDEIKDYLIIMGSSKTGYTIYNDEKKLN